MRNIILNDSYADILELDLELGMLHYRIKTARRMVKFRKRWLSIMQEDLAKIGGDLIEREQTYSMAKSNIYSIAIRNAFEEFTQAEQRLTLLEEQETKLLIRRNDMRYDC